MRHNITKRNSTKAERIVYETLKELKVPFKHRWIIQGREIDFIIGSLALEIDGHEQNIDKNNMLIKNGYTPIHLYNNEVNKNIIKELLKNYAYTH